MDVQMPVYLYDVTTATDTPRLVTTCRNAEGAQEIAVRLNAMRTAGIVEDDPFVVAAPRSAVVTMDVEPGSSVMIKGRRVDMDVIAAALDAQEKAKDAVPDVTPIRGI